MRKLGHCRDGYHAYCGGEAIDRVDGTLVECECWCHRDGEYLSEQATYYQESKEEN